MADGRSAAAGGFLQAAQTLCARLCHDVSGEAGGLAALLAPLAGGKPGPSVSTEELGLAADLALGLSARVQLLRFAFTRAAEQVGAPELLARLGGLSVPARVRLETDGLEDAVSLDGEMAQLAVCLAMLGVASVRGNGLVRLSVDDGSRVVLAIAGPRAGWPTGLSLWLADPSAALAGMDDPRWVAGPYACLLASEAGIRLSFLLDAAGGALPPLLASRS